MNWSDDELTVMFAIFVSQPFKVGDDNHPVNGRIASTFGRSRSAIDSQWRNLKHHLWRLDLYDVGRAHIGQNVKDVVDRYRIDLSALRHDALEIIDREGWALSDLVED